MTEEQKQAILDEAATIDTSDTVGLIIDHESGGLSAAETVALFQSLVNNGMAWTLQGHYCLIESSLIEAGLVSA